MIADRFRSDVLALLRALPGLANVDFEPLLAIPPRPEQGDYALPTFSLARTLRRAPALIAGGLAAEANERLGDFPALARVEAAGPFVNVFVEPTVRARQTLAEVHERAERYGDSDAGAGRVVAIDFSSPNIAKPFGIGHLRSTVIGSALCNLYRSQGYTPAGINHIGDWGKQFGMLMVALEQEGLQRLEQADDKVDYLFRLYVDVHRRADEDPQVEEQARGWFRRLEQGDASAREMWQRCVGASLEEFDRIYELLGVSHNFDRVWGESHYEGAPMDRVVQELRDAELLVESNDAHVVFLGEDQPPCLILKSDGATLYATRDLAAAIYRKEAFDAWRLVYVVGVPQSLHFGQVFEVLRRMGYGWADNCVHVPFGLIRFPDGAMSTRRGRVVLLKDVLARAAAMAAEIMAERGYAADEMALIAEQVGIGAVIFADLSAGRIKDWEFRWEELLNFNGRTGPYLQYTHARLASLLRKHGGPVPERFDGACLADPAAQAVLRTIGRFPATLGAALEQHEPALVARYLLDLAETLNTFYNAHRILDAPEPGARGARVALVAAVRQVLANGLRLLGIPIPERM